jgi:hypothetical protein
MTSHVDYDNIETFNKVLDAVKDIGYSDTSYGNDTCPSISRDFDNGNWQQVWIDYANPEMREDAEWPMFNVVMFDENHNELATDSFDNVEELILRLKG